MLKEFLTVIQETAVRAAGATIVQPPGDTRTAWLVHNGKADPITLPPSFRRHTLGSIDSLTELVTRFPAAMVWHDESSVVAQLDQNDRRDRAELPLQKSEAFLLLETIGKQRPMFTQRDLIRMLRTEFRAAGAEHLLTAVKRVDFKRTNSGKASLEHGKESLGRSVEMEVNSAEAIPEEVRLTVPVYTTPGADWHKTVYCTLEIDVANERFAILPDRDSLTAAIHEVQADLHESLAEALGEIPLYYGAP